MASARSQQVKEHQAWADLNNLDQFLANAESLLPGEDPDVGAAYLSLLALAKHTRIVLKSMNALIVPLPQLDAVDSAIQGISSSVTAANQQVDDTQLITAWTQADNLLAALAKLPVVKSRHDVTAMTEAMAQFQKQISDALEELEGQTEELSSEIGEAETRQSVLSNQIAEQKASLTQTVSEFETKILTVSNDFDTQIASLQATQESENAEAFEEVQEKLTAVENQADKFYEQEEERHTEQLRKLRAEFDKTQTERDNLAKATAEEHAAQATEIISKLQADLAEAKKLVGMIGEVTMTGHFERNAKEQRIEADRWRWGTVTATIAAVASAGVLALWGLIVPGDRDWLDYARGFGLTVALSALATYLGAQSRIHRNLETRYRSLELELATLDPFLSTMTDDERHNIKTQLATRYFVGVEPNAPLLDGLEKEESE